MSQRTRSRTADVAANAPELTSSTRTRKGKRVAPEATPVTVTPSEMPLSAPMLAPDALARALRAVAAELERDPELAQRVTDAITATPTASALSMATAEHETADDGASHTATGNTGKTRAFRPRLVTGAPPELGPGIPDPFALRKRLGEAGLRAALAELRLGSLRAIVREHRLDPGGKVVKLNDPEKLRVLILAATN
ncbi:MAG: hypothetical protein ABI068_05730 [Ktedonobacterales bacterium]